MYKKITVALAAAALSVSMAVPAMAQWNQNGNSWQWVENGAAVKDQWVTTANGQYYINLDGVVSSGWINWNGNWYYGEPTGANLGNLVKNSFAKVNGKVYYFGGNGAMATGTQNIGGVNYTFAADGSCTTTPNVSMPTYGSGSTAVAGGSVSGGGGSSSGGSGSVSTTKGAYEVGSDIKNNASAIKDELEASEGFLSVSAPSVSANGNKVTVSASATVDKNATAADVFSDAIGAVMNSDYAGDITSIKFNNLTASSLGDLDAKAHNILGEMSVEAATKMSKTKTATAEVDTNGDDKGDTVVEVTFNYTVK